MNYSNMNSAEPFLKWAGGKRQLINEIENVFPKTVKKTRKIGYYIEPFVGGGALLFYLLSNYEVERALINDINPDLILAYRIIKNKPEELIHKLEKRRRDRPSA